MLLVLFTMDGNKQEEKWLIVEHNALKWIKANNALSKRSHGRVPMANGMIVTSTSQLRWL
jgi:tRNA(Phe) wybutosine-synthesizing methylase Tyw3